MLKGKRNISITMVFLVLMASMVILLSTDAAANGTTTQITIESDGSVDPSTAAISVSGTTYTLTSDITGCILIEKSGITLDGAGYTLTAPTDDTEDDWGIKYSNIYNLVIKNINITGFDLGLYAGNGVRATSSNPNTLDEVILWENYDGAKIVDDHLLMKNSSIINNERNGLYLDNADHNTFECNKFQSNGDKGFYVKDSDNNLIKGNRFTDSSIGFYSNQYSNDNEIYYNNFIDNDDADDDGGNIWNDGNGKGNYWSDYEGNDDGSNSRTANDGVGDTDLPHNGLDYYPLMERYTCDVEEDPCELIADLIDDVEDLSLSSCRERYLKVRLNRACRYHQLSDRYEDLGYSRYARFYEILSIRQMFLFKRLVGYYNCRGWISNTEKTDLCSSADDIIDLL